MAQRHSVQRKKLEAGRPWVWAWWVDTGSSEIGHKASEREGPVPSDRREKGQHCAATSQGSCTVSKSRFWGWQPVFCLSGWMKKTDPWAWNINYSLCLCHLEREEIRMNGGLGGNARGCAWRACILPGRSAQGTSAQQFSESTAFLNRDTDFCAVCKKSLKMQAWWPLLEREKKPHFIKKKKAFYALCKVVKN